MKSLCDNSDLNALKEKLSRAQAQVRAKNVDEALSLLEDVLIHEDHLLDEKDVILKARTLSDSIKHYRRLKRFRLLSAGIILVAALIISILSRTKVPSSRIELQLNVSELSFVTAKDWNILSLEAKTIGITRLDSISLEVITVEEASDYDFESDEVTGWLRLPHGDRMTISKVVNNWSVELESEYLNLSSLYVEAGSRVTLTKDVSVSDLVKLSIVDGNVYGSIATGDTILLSCSNCEIVGHKSSGEVETRSLRVISFDNQVDFEKLDAAIDLTAEGISERTSEEPIILSKALHVREIEFTRPVGETLTSTILHGGALVYPELDSEKLPIRENDFLILGDLVNFQIKSLQLSQHLSVTVEGKVGKLDSGTEEFLYSRLPSLLEWLYKNHTLKLILPVILAASAFIYKILNELRVDEH